MDERRKAFRERMDRSGVKVTLFLVKPTGTYSKHEIEPSDFSTEGMGFDYTSSLPVGDHCEFEITVKGQKLHVISKVARCDQTTAGTYSIGVKFDQVLPKGFET